MPINKPMRLPSGLPLPGTSRDLDPLKRTLDPLRKDNDLKLTVKDKSKLKKLLKK